MICVFFYGSAAAAPAELSDMERRVLVEAHGDVVDLVMPSIEGRAYWRWRQA